jgi:hypothetical protein
VFNRWFNYSWRSFLLANNNYRRAELGVLWLSMLIDIVVILMMTVCESACKLEGGIGACYSAAELKRDVFIDGT